MRLYLIRHADPDYPNDTITPTGHAEAAALAQRLATYNLTHLYQSPLGRARATAKYIADATGLPPTTLDWTCEVGDCFYHHESLGRLGAWDTPGEVLRADPPCRSLDDWHRIDDPTAHTLKQKLHTLAHHSDNFLATHGYQRINGRYRPIPPTAPESPSTPSDRQPHLAAAAPAARPQDADRTTNPPTAPALHPPDSPHATRARCITQQPAQPHPLQRVPTDPPTPSPHQIAVVCHGGLSLFWLAHLLEIPLPLLFASLWHAPSSVTTLLFDHRSPHWATPRALAIADTSHLYAQNLPIQPRGIIANYF